MILFEPVSLHAAASSTALACLPAMTSHPPSSPGLPCQVESLRVGLRRLRELWPGLTPAALADSEPLHLSLALKALGLNGPPKGY